MGPYNYPLYETFTAVAPALLTGNTVIIKAPRFGSLLFKPLLQLFREAFPKSSVNVLFGTGQEKAPALMSSGRIVLAFNAQAMVTHDLSEAFALADKIIVYSQGRIAQIGPPKGYRT
jgi:glyceraldehyde-3-phosphate dehydrogenase (NADP+)